MAKLGWLILGLLVLWAHPGHATTMAQCPDGAHYYVLADGVSTCPDSFTVTGATPSTTSVTLTGTVTENSGIVHSTIRLNCTLLQWRNTTAGVINGAEADGDDTDVSSGAFSINVTGLAEGTTYCAHLVQYANDRPTVQKTIQFTTTESAPPPEDVGAEITGGDDWFYCPDGNDANSGLTNALRKATIPATDTTTLGAGDDMWLCTGGVWINSHHDIARQGSSGDWNEIGTYYMDGATPRKAVDGVEGPGTTHTKAVIKGALTDSCLAAGTCTFPDTPTGASGYSSKYDALWVATSTADYTDIRNIAFSHFQYGSFNSSGGGVEGALHHLILDGVDLYYGGINSRLTFTDGVTDIVVRNSDTYGQTQCASTRVARTSSDTTACTTQPWTGTLVTITRKSGRMLVENNTTRRGMGEGINCFNTSVGKVIWRGNKVVNVWSDGMYLDGCQDAVVENNIIMGGTGVMYPTASSGAPAFTGVHIGCEATTYPDATGHVIRNNLFVGAGQGIEGNMFGVCATAGDLLGAKVYGNTAIANGDREMAMSEVAANVEEWDVQNNAFWNDDVTTAICSATSAMDGVDNAWSHNPSDADCDGAGDTIGSLGLTQSTYATWKSTAAVNGDAAVTWVTFAQANPAGGSALIGSGTALTSAILDKDTYGFAYEQIAEVLAGGGASFETNWECALCVDATGATRANPPSKGAVE